MHPSAEPKDTTTKNKADHFLPNLRRKTKQTPYIDNIISGLNKATSKYRRSECYEQGFINVLWKEG